ncbi:tyrosine-type recombinase/integrase [Acidobacterium sp. S8]|uniref:tyrosine-type recombinase/integrase n=1 Tax=Acidobacterium sp. S8 TaxID=1641854 RepID=UPI00131BBEC6|nr:tyrosine-type recombinase/integrase [Acidobacterium sp. S8]
MKGSIRKTKLKGKRISWAYVINVGRDREGKRKQVVRSGFTTEHEAEAKMREAIATFEKGHTVQSDSRTFESFFTSWLKQHGAAHWGNMTAEQNAKRAGYAIRMFGDVPMQKLTPQRIEQDLHTLLTRGGIKTKDHPKGRPLSPKSVREIGALISQCLDKARRWKLIESNPMEDVDRPAAHRKEVEILQLEDFERLLQRIRGTRYYAFCVFAADTGCRRGEQLALKWSDIDLETGMVTISKALSQTNVGREIKTPKSRKSRSFRISEDTLTILREHREQLELEKEMYGEDYQNNNLVFPTPEGDYYQPNQVTNRISAFMREAGVKGSLHKLRHLNASTMLSEKVPLPIVSRRLGHANSQITLNVYAHVMKDDDMTASLAWNGVTSGIISRTRKPAENGSSKGALVTFSDIKRPKLA